MVGRLDAQGVSEAGTSLSATVEHNNDGAGSPEMSKAMGKTEQEERAKTTVAQAIKGAKKLEEAVMWPSPHQCDAKMATTAPGTPKKETPAM